MNNWNFTGNLGRDAEQRYTPSGDAIVSFSVGVKSGYGEKASTTWANCAMFGKRGEAVAQYLTKGMLVGISGEVNNREYQDKEGQKRYSLDVRVNDLTLLSGKSESVHTQKPVNSAKQSAHGSMPDSEDIPFNQLGAYGEWRVM